MVPEKYHFEGDKIIVDRPAFGIASEINQDGEFVELWRTEGWYTFEGFLSNDGRYFVRMGLWASDQEHHTDLAVAFYDRGKLIKQYQVKDLIRRESMLEYSVSHYRWRPSKQSEPTGFSSNGVFHLVMIDKTTYDFEVGNGEILSTDVDKDALSQQEIRRMADDQAAKDGQKLLQESGKKADFEAAFQLLNVHSSKNFKTYGVYFEEREWGADMTPKKPLKHGAEVECVFKVTNAGSLVIGISPEELLAALKVITEHPYVESRFTRHEAGGLRLRVAGDRLHWDSDELQKMFKIAGMSGTDLNSWAYVIVDEPKHSFHSLYLNIRSGEIIREDTATWPYGVIRINKDGNTVKK